MTGFWLYQFQYGQGMGAMPWRWTAWSVTGLCLTHLSECWLKWKDCLLYREYSFLVVCKGKMIKSKDFGNLVTSIVQFGTLSFAQQKGISVCPLEHFFSSWRTSLRMVWQGCLSFNPSSEHLFCNSKGPQGKIRDRTPAFLKPLFLSLPTYRFTYFKTLPISPYHFLLS